MGTDKIMNSKVHHGYNIRRVRMEKNIKQELLSDKVHMSQPTVSRYENMRVIDEEILQRFAKALDVPVDCLETMEEDAQTVVFENISNDVHDNKDGVTVPSGYANNPNTNYNFNPIDKIAELYERLLKEKDEKYAALEQRIKKLEEEK